MNKPVELTIFMRDKTRQGIESASQNVDGLTNDYEDLIRAIRESNAEMERSGKSAQNMAGGFGNMQSMLFKLGGTTALVGLGKEIINVRGEIQMMEKSFEVLLGSKQKADAMLADIKNIALKSPLSLSDTSKAAQTLLSFNIAAEKVIPTLEQIGNISMGDSQKFTSLTLAFAQMSSTGKLMGQDLLQMINAGFNPLSVISEKTGKSIGELKKEMEGGAISADTVADAFASATAEGGKFHGMMEAQSEGLAGLQASLGDAWTNMLNEIGQGNNEIIAGGYKLTASLVRNYETIGKVLVSLVATFGTYKAAVVLAATAEKGWTVAQMAHFNVLLLVEKAQKLLNATMLANPYVLLGTVIVGLAAAMWTLYDSTTAEGKAQKKLNDVLEETKQKKENLKNKSNELISVIKDETQTVYAQIKAWKELQKELPDSFGKMTLEEFKNLAPEEITLKINAETEKNELEELNKKLEGAKEKVGEINKILNSPSNQGIITQSVQGEKLKEAQAYSDALKDQVGEMKRLKKEAEFDAKPAAEKIAYYNSEIDKLDIEKRRLDTILLTDKDIKDEWGNINWETTANINRLETVNSKINEMKGKVKSLNDLPANANYGDLYSKAKTEWESSKKELKAIEKDKNNFTKEQYENAKKREETAKKSYNELGGDTTVKKTSGTSAAEKAKRQLQEQEDINAKIIKGQAKAALERRQAELDNRQKLLDIEKDGFDKKQKQIELNHQKELLNIDKHARELIEKQQEAEKLQWEKDGKKGTFVPKTAGILDLLREQKNELVQQETTLNKMTAADTAKLLKDRLEPYRTFAQQRIDIEKKYQDDIKALRESGTSEENIRVAEQAQTDALTALDEEMAQKEETFRALMLQIGYMSLTQLEKSLKEAENALKKSEATGGKNTKESATLRAKIKALQEELKAVKAEKDIKDSDPVAKWNKQSAAIKKCKSEVDGMVDSMDFLDETTKDALKAASNIADGAIAMIDGIKKLGFEAAASIGAVEKASVILAIVGAAVQIVTAIFNMASKAEKAHQEALAEVAKNKLAMQREYNLLLLEQNLLLEKATTIFGEEQIAKAANAMAVYQQVIADFKKELKGSAPEMNFMEKMSNDFLGSYQKRLDDYNKGIGALNEITVKTGHHKTGLFGWGKGKDEYSSILSVYDDLLTSEGKLNTERAQAILDTQTMSDENRELLQSLIDLQDAADKAEEALRDYLQETFGSLGSDLTDAVVDSIKNGTDAWEAFGDAGAKVIENLGRQMIYELAFAKKFAQLQKDLEAIYEDTDLSPEEIAKKEMDVLSGFFAGMGDAAAYAERLGKQFQEEAAKRGFDIWQSDDEGSSQTGKAGAFTTMTQEQGTKLEGLFTSVQNHTANIDEQIGDIYLVMHAAGDTLLRIEENTSYCRKLEGIYDFIQTIIRDGLKVK